LLSFIYMRKLVVISLILGLFILPVGGIEASISDLLDLKHKELEMLDEQIKKYEESIKEKQTEAKTLKGELAIIEERIEKIKLQIKETEAFVEELTLAIKIKIKEIEDREIQMAHQKVLLTQYIRLLYEYDQESILEVILKEEKISSFFERVNSMEKIQGDLQEALHRIAILKEELESQKEELEGKKEEQSKLRIMQELQRKSLEEQESQGKQLLIITRGQEERFQKLLSQTKEFYSKTSSQIFILQSLDNPISFEEAVEEARFASSLTGARTSFLLGVLKVESNLGTNIGSGNWREDMSSSQWKYFFEICKELDFEPSSMPVSKKPIFYDGWGGAMGPAQFMPRTWQGYKKKVAELTGNSPANPWNLRDAMVGMALKLSQVSGVVEADTDAEYKAAGLYFAGSNWKKFTWYSDQVMWYADMYEEIL